MIENRQREMSPSLAIRLHQQIAAPDAIARQWAWDTVLQVEPRCEDQILVASAGVRDLGLTHRHLSPAPPPPIEVMRNRLTARVRHGGFESDDLVLDPSGFEWGEDLAWRYRLLTTPSVWRAVYRLPSTHDLPYP